MVIEANIQPESLHRIFTFLRATGDADHPASENLSNLADGGTHGSGGGCDDESLSRFRLAVVAEQVLGVVAVAGVGRASGGACGRTLVLVVTQVRGELGIENAVDEALFELGEQVVRADSRF
jgi:hypothetical protein